MKGKSTQGSCLLTNQHGLKKSGRGSSRNLSTKLFDNQYDTIMEDNFFEAFGKPKYDPRVLT